MLTRNNASLLPRLLASVTDFDEVIVCDGGSDDGTVELARREGCVVIAQAPEFQAEDGRLRDFFGARNQMLDVASNTWFFQLDSDEDLSTELVEEIRSTLADGPQASGFLVPFTYRVGARLHDAASGYPGYQIRLFRTDRGLRYSGAVHESIGLDADTLPALQAPYHRNLPPARRLPRRWAHYLALEGRTVDPATPIDRLLRGRVKWTLEAGARTMVFLGSEQRRRADRPLPVRYELLSVTYRVASAAVWVATAVRQRSRRSRPEGRHQRTPDGSDDGTC